MSIYQSIYNLLEQYIFGTVTAGTTQALVTELMATGACIFVTALPFIVVLKVISLILGR